MLPGRLVSIDAYRGFVMLLLLGEVLRFCDVAAARPHSGFWAFLSHHQSHVPWVGASLHDLIQPGFSFLVGTALAFSVAARGAAGQSRLVGHAAWRALVLIVLGIWLRSIGRPQTYFTFEDTLTQIGLGYLFLFLLALRPRRDQRQPWPPSSRVTLLAGQGPARRPTGWPGSAGWSPPDSRGLPRVGSSARSG